MVATVFSVFGEPGTASRDLARSRSRSSCRSHAVLALREQRSYDEPTGVAAEEQRSTELPSTTPLVGREQELAAIARAVSSPPALVLIEGEAGIGKTRLVRELLARSELRGVGSFVGSFPPLREPFPLGAIVEALGHAEDLPAVGLSPVVGALRPLLPELASRLPPAPPPLQDTRGERHRTFRAVAELLGALGPAVLVLEDLHWADEATEEFLAFLESAPPANLAVVLTCRAVDLPSSSRLPEIVSRPSAELRPLRISLGPLDRDHVARLVSSALDADDVSDEFAAFLHDQTAGIPFAVEELLRLLYERGDLVRTVDGWSRKPIEEILVPAAIRDSILERIARLRPGPGKAVQAAAVLGVPAIDRVIGRVAGIPEARVAGAISDALRSSLLHEAGGGLYAFRHVLARQAVYDAIPAPERARLHLKAARSLEARSDRSAAQLARHYRNAGRPRHAARHAEAAAALATSHGDDAGAVRFLQDALSLPGLSAATRGRLAAGLGRAALDGLAHREAVAILRAILDDARFAAGVRGELRLLLGRLLLQSGETSAGLAEVERSVRDLRGSPALAARAMVMLAVPWVHQGRLSEHLRWLERALRSLDRLSDPALRAAILAERATILVLVGDPAGWRAALDLRPGRSREERREHIRGAGNLAQASFYLGHYGRARAFLDQARAGVDELGYARILDDLTAVELLLAWATGRWEGLEERAEAHWKATTENANASEDARLLLGLLLEARGDLDRAVEHLSTTLERTARVEGVPLLAASSSGLARIRLARGDATGALSIALPALDVVRDKNIWVWAAELAPVAVEALAALGRLQEAGGLARQFERGLRGRDAPAPVAALAVCRGLVAEAEGRSSAAERWFARAAGAWGRLPRPYEAARARERQAGLLLARGHDRGLTLLREALAAYTSLGAARDADRLRRTARKHGLALPRPWRGGRRGYGDRLSPREEEVARLAGGGSTDLEIAAALYLSRWTVAHHVASAKRKLGAASRRELAAALAKDG